MTTIDQRAVEHMANILEGKIVEMAHCKDAANMLRALYDQLSKAEAKVRGLNESVAKMRISDEQFYRAHTIERKLVAMSAKHKRLLA